MNRLKDAEQMPAVEEGEQDISNNQQSNYDSYGWSSPK